MKVLWPFVWPALLATALFAGVGAVDVSKSLKAADQNLRFPQVAAVDLAKRPVTLPRDFLGQRNLVLIAFQRQQQKDVDTWLKHLKQFEDADPALRCYELPVIARVNPVARWFIENGMRGGISSQQQREHTITLYLDKGPFRAALGIADENQIHVLLLDRDGSILWRAEGIFDEKKAISLKEALERLTHAH
jgi:hypothetical protein